jgi:hypothetical protein
MPLGHAVDDIGQIGLRVETVQLRRFQNGVEDRGPLTTGLGAQEEKILSRKAIPRRDRSAGLLSMPMRPSAT